LGTAVPFDRIDVDEPFRLGRAYFVVDRPGRLVLALYKSCGPGMFFVEIDMASGERVQSPVLESIDNGCDVTFGALSNDGSRLAATRLSGPSAPEVAVYDVAAAAPLFVATEPMAFLMAMTPDGDA